MGIRPTPEVRLRWEPSGEEAGAAEQSESGEREGTPHAREAAPVPQAKPGASQHLVP